MAVVTAGVLTTAAALSYMKSRNQKAAIRSRMMELWKDKSKDPTSQWKNVKKSLGDVGLEAQALKEAQAIWKKHQADIKKSRSTRNTGKTFDTKHDQIYVVKPDAEVPLTKDGKYKGNAGEWHSLKKLGGKPGEKLTAKEFEEVSSHLFQSDADIAKEDKEIAASGAAADLHNQIELANSKERAALNKQLVALRKNLKDGKPPLKDQSSDAAKFANVTTQSLDAAIEKTKQDVIPEYEDILKMKRGKNRDELTLKHWEKKGYDFEGLSKRDRRELANELRIGHAWETGKGTVMWKPENRGMHKVFKQTREDLTIKNTTEKKVVTPPDTKLQRFNDSLTEKNTFYS